MVTPREHIEEIRKTKFSIGGELNPLTEDLHQAVKNLSAELYAKDVHFLMELIQNAEDNEYPEGVDPSLEFVITSRDITNIGAPATLLVFNNEKGFSPENIESICSVGRSTKKGNRKRGYIGEKGIGFKSVFLITAQPYIFSNGYQIKFSEDPCVHCNVGYIVPEWAEKNPTLSDIKQIYGCGTALPATTVVLPLKPDKVKPVKQQLSSIHPEVLLFLTKIKRLSVREDNEDPRLSTVSAISISSETDFVTRKKIEAESYTLHLSADENGNESERECRYHMWKQKFPVRHEFRVERRMEVEEWVITLAFPFGERLHRGTSSPGVYAFLPTEMVTNLPFIIQADFLLASSRETILLDNKWNQGILNCVPFAFVNAFISLVRTTETPVFNLPHMFRFLPVQSSSYEKLNVVRESIKAQLVEENIVPSEPHMEQKFFHKPCEVGRLLPAFWNILMKARAQGISLSNLSSHGKYVLCHSFDTEEYDHVLNFLEVEPVNDEWYAKCIQSSNLVVRVSEDVYLELLLFIADNWRSKFLSTNIKNIPLIKCADLHRNVSLCSLSEMRIGEKNVCLSIEPCHISWLIDWSREFISVASLLFLPESTQIAIRSCSKNEKLVEWLVNEMNVFGLNVYKYADLLNNSLKDERKLAVSFAHFLYQSLRKSYISDPEVDRLCGNNMPLVDSYGYVNRQRSGVIVPAKESKWSRLTDSNLWRGEGFVELGEDYMNPGHFAGTYTPENKLLEFLKDHASAKDVPFISAPNACIPTVSAPLTKPNAFLLLDWIRHLNHGIYIPPTFLKCLKEGSWLKVTLNGFSGFRPPSQSFVLTSSWGDILQNGSVFVDIPLVDQSYYGERINGYKEELKALGVMFEYKEACEFIGNHLMSLAASSTLTRGNVFSILRFIKFLRVKFLSPEDFIRSIQKGQWLKTHNGYRSPVGSVLFDQKWRIASQISNIPFIDQEFYGEEILNFKTELELLGVVVSFYGSYQLIIDYLKSPPYLTSLTREAVLLMLQIMHDDYGSSDKLVKALKGTKCLKTSNGYKSPGECFLFDPEWGCILQVFKSLPVIDHNYYGSSVLSYRNELKRTGVVVEFEEAAKGFAHCFRQSASSASITKENVVSFLACCRQLKGTPFKFPADLKSCIREVKWLRTRLGDYRSPRQCILFSPEWESISPLCLLPFIDDSENYYGNNIHEYKKELKMFGVVVELKDGVKFVASCLYFRQYPSYISPENALALLECMQILLQEKDYSFPESFMKKVSRAYLKTHAGYKPPGECLLFNSKFGEHLKRTDGPFIDEEFYGSKITSYGKELSAIGVTVEVADGCPLIAGHVDLHDEFSTFVRIYNYLSEFKWEPDSEAARRIRIPEGNQKWVRSDECVIYDKDELFGLQFTVLEKYFEQKLLIFFSAALGVKSRPSIEDYCELWNIWESSEKRLSHSECCKFWKYVSKNWNKRTEKTLANAFVKVPVNSGSDEIFLLNKCDVFLTDDLQLKDIFEQSSSHPIFVWYPQPSLPSLPRTSLLEIYRQVGVRTISESVEKEEVSLENGVEQVVIPRDNLIGKELLRLILGFLADPTIEMEAKRRHEAVQCLLNLTVVETTEPISVSFKLPLSSGEILNVRASRKIRWDRESSKFFTQKMDKSGPGAHKNLLEFATFFSEAISNGVLWENIDHIHALSELIKVAFVLEFNKEAVDFLMKSKNLQIFMEDEEFLKSAFPSE